MKLTNKQISDLEALKLYIKRNFEKFNIEIDVDYVLLQYIPYFRIIINGKCVVLESELLAYTFLDGMYIVLDQ